MSKFPFIGPSYQSWSLLADAQQVMNLYPESIESGSGKNVAALYGTPGLALNVTLPKTPIRGLWPGENRLFAVAGDTLYEILAGGGLTTYGSVGNDGKPVQMFPNGTGTQLLIISNGKVYVSTGGAPVLAAFTGGGDVPAVMGAFLDGYFVVQESFSSRQFNISAIDDGTTWDPLDFAVKEGYPDNIAALLADHEELWLFGDEAATEVWRNTGNPDFPFERDPGAFIHFANLAPWATVRLTNGVAWIGGDETRGGPVAYFAQGFYPVRISNHAVEQAWSSYSTVKDAIAYVYIDHGHEFWCINFPTANATWVFDTNTNLWHQRGWWNGAGFDRQRQTFHAYVDIGDGPIHYVGDWQNGNIYRMSTAVYTDNGTAIHRVRACPHISEEQAWIFYSMFQLDAEFGNGSITPSLDWSDDGGATWHTARTPDSGTMTAHGQRCLWRRMGRSRDRVFRVTISDAVKVALVNAYLEFTLGRK